MGGRNFKLEPGNSHRDLEMLGVLPVPFFLFL